MPRAYNTAPGPLLQSYSLPSNRSRPRRASCKARQRSRWWCIQAECRVRVSHASCIPHACPTLFYSPQTCIFSVSPLHRALYLVFKKEEGKKKKKKGGLRSRFWVSKLLLSCKLHTIITMERGQGERERKRKKKRKERRRFFLKKIEAK